jgi:GUN4-like
MRTKPLKIFFVIITLLTLFFIYKEFFPPSLNQLESYLVNQEWEKADGETRNLILKITKRKWFGEWLVYLKIEGDPIKNFPCGYLTSIDRLWVKYSGGRFGFSVQDRIIEKILAKTKPAFLEDSYDAFFKELGWEWHKDTFQYTLSAPPGHLPSYEWMTQGITKPKIWATDGIYLYERLQACKSEIKDVK